MQSFDYFSLKKNKIRDKQKEFLHKELFLFFL